MPTHIVMDRTGDILLPSLFPAGGPWTENWEISACLSRVKAPIPTIPNFTPGTGTIVLPDHSDGAAAINGGCFR